MIDGLSYYTPKKHIDYRGEFCELYGADFSPFPIKQISQSTSFRNVFRGFHFQPGMKKALRVVKGAVILYAMDMRPNSSTFGVISPIYAGEGSRFYISEDFIGRAFYTQSNDTVVQYYHSERYDTMNSYAVKGYNSFGFADYVTASEKDRNAMTVAEWKVYALENRIFI